MPGVFRKDPDATLDYGFDWSSWLAEDETIATSAWEVPAGLIEGEDSRSNTTTTIWLSGGTAGQTYELTNTISTSENRIDERTFKLICEER